MRTLYLLALGWVAVGVLSIAATRVKPTILHHATPQPTAFSGDGGTWFQQVRGFCNPVEVDVQLSWNPPPPGLQGAGYGAACYALAGRIDQARELILELEGDDRWRAAGIVFNVGHPVADAGDDRAAGPIMELVVEFWPNHYMALYHAGASRWALGDHDAAQRYLTDFLEYYELEDGWTASARSILKQFDER